MTDSTLGRGEQRDRTIRLVLHLSLALAAGFETFAWITTQVKPVRAASPWQNDPYDVVVSFTEFLVPALACLIALRMVLWRGKKQQPPHRTAQLLRAATASTVLVTATIAADWIALAVRANRPAWSLPATAILAAALVPLTAAAVANLWMRYSLLRRLPVEQIHGSDWLDDLPPLLALATGGDRTTWIRRCTPMLTLIRGHFLATTALVALTAALSLAGIEAHGEKWTDPMLFVFAVVVAAGGFFAAAVLGNRYLVIVAQPPAPGRVRRALRLAVGYGALCLPATVAVRGEILHLVGDDHDNSPAHLLLLIVVSAAATATAVFTAALARRQAA
ncbi:hypothetical protein [Nocardia stercoris]|uniref:Uncharacterized protein n=1 Tax=Nocardia stercoris TaxID=2483361 RepID=A0A3M2L205_9NOCA|nr:hypothetical protein [Nocardia stercoris]RMI31732.1 hypothetical protein EBN03_16145 [Nocardia stercoris]